MELMGLELFGDGTIIGYSIMPIKMASLVYSLRLLTWYQPHGI